MGFEWTDCYLQKSKALPVQEINICDKQTVKSGLTTSTIFNESAIDMLMVSLTVTFDGDDECK